MKLYAIILALVGLAVMAAFVFSAHYAEIELENRRFEVTLTTTTGKPMQISSYSTIRSEMDLQRTEFMAGEEITVYQRLVNLGPESAPITHGKPILRLSVYDADGDPAGPYLDMGLILSVGAASWIDAGGTHLEHYSFTLDEPGEYTVESYASFSAVETKIPKGTQINQVPDLEKSRWTLYAEPVTITILPGSAGQQTEHNITLPVFDPGMWPAPTERQAAPCSTLPAFDPDVRPVLDHDSRMAEIEKYIPGFGGVFMEDGILTIYVAQNRADPAQTHEERKVCMGAYFGPHRLAQGLVVLEGQYTYPELVTVKNHITPLLEQNLGITMVGVDDKTNRVLVGIQNAAREDKIMSELARMGITEEMIHISVTGSIRLAR